MKLSMLYLVEARSFVTLYHGTSATKGRAIMNVGLIYDDNLTTTPNADEDHVYVSTDPKTAIGYMEYSAEPDKALIVVWANPRMLLPDEDHIIDVIHAGIRAGDDSSTISANVLAAIGKSRPGVASRTQALVSEIVEQSIEGWHGRSSSDPRPLIHKLTRMLRGTSLGSSHRLATPVGFRGAAKVIGGLIMSHDKNGGSRYRVVGTVPGAAELGAEMIERYGNEHRSEFWWPEPTPYLQVLRRQRLA